MSHIIPDTIHVVEVGLRDGLQNHPTHVSTEDKLHILEMLVAAGVDTIETGSFVRPDLVPQMADSAEILRHSLHHPINNMSLIINERGYDRAYAAGSRSMASVVMVSESMSERNSGMSVARSVQIAQRLAVRAARDDVRMRIYVSTAWVCPYEGQIAPEKVLRVAEKLIALEPAELALSDTIGHAHPMQVASLIELMARRIELERITVHLHDTQGLGMANAYAAIDSGVRTLDASFGGLGGCPFAPGAKGNIATEDLVFLAHKMGFETGIDLEKLLDAVEFAEGVVGRPLGGRARGLFAPDKPHPQNEFCG